MTIRATETTVAILTTLITKINHRNIINNIKKHLRYENLISLTVFINNIIVEMPAHITLVDFKYIFLSLCFIIDRMQFQNRGANMCNFTKFGHFKGMCAKSGSIDNTCIFIMQVYTCCIRRKFSFGDFEERKWRKKFSSQSFELVDGKWTFGRTSNCISTIRFSDFSRFEDCLFYRQRQGKTVTGFFTYVPPDWRPKNGVSRMLSSRFGRFSLWTRMIVRCKRALSFTML